jgi:hypothetical protein
MICFSTDDNSVAARFKVWVCGRSLAGAAGSNPAGAWIAVSSECRVLSRRDLCYGLITRPQESLRDWCYRNASTMR